jgi:hypothetical protein
MHNIDRTNPNYGGLPANMKQMNTYMSMKLNGNSRISTNTARKARSAKLGRHRSLSILGSRDCELALLSQSPGQ